MKFKDEIGINLSRIIHFWIFRRLGIFKKEYLPNFFVISPPKTGSTWLSYNLNCHPEIFIPEVKEIKYFSNHWRTEKFNWYQKHFEEAGDKIKGDASPSYAILPIRTIQFIKLIKPDLKLIFLMRDPVDRSWSHAKHSYKYCEPGFKSYADGFDSVSDESLIDAFQHDWLLAPADYLGCLKRWLMVFPKDQLYIGFYETIKYNPKNLLNDIFDFLGVQKKVDWSQFRIYETIFKGNRRKLPDRLKVILKSLHQKKIQQLSHYLKEQFNIEIPTDWKNTLAATDKSSTPHIVESGKRGFNISKYGEFTDQHLVAILDMENAHTLPLLWTVFMGFYIVRYKGIYYALSKILGNIDLTQLDDEQLNLYKMNGHCTVQKTILKTKITIFYFFIKKISKLCKREIVR